MNGLTTAILLSTATFAIVNYLIDPIRVNYPDLNLWWVIYISFIVGALVGFFSGVNLFVDHIANEMLARILTGAVIGGGSNLIYQVFGKEVKPRL